MDEHLKENTSSNLFTWVKTHEEVVEFLKTQKHSQLNLIQILQSIGITGFSDKDENDNPIDLQELDPFTFFRYIYKFSDNKRLTYLQKLAEILHFHNKPIDTSGLPNANALSVWLFPCKKDRTHGEIDKLWRLFFSALDGTITNEIFADALSNIGVGKATITEALFYILPSQYLPINGPVKEYLKEKLNMNPEFKTYEDYLHILEHVRSKTNQSFYELSYIASESRSKWKKYWIYSPGEQASKWNEFYQNSVMKIRWGELGNLKHKFKY